MKNQLRLTDDIFYRQAGLDKGQVQSLVSDALRDADDGELFLEHSVSEGFYFQDGDLKSSSRTTMEGFGLRYVAGEAFGYAHSPEFSEQAMRNAAAKVRQIRSQPFSGSVALAPSRPLHSLYAADNPLDSMSDEKKIQLLADIDQYLRQADPRVKQVTASLAATTQYVQIIRPGGSIIADVRPLVRMNVSVMVKDQNGRRETGGHGSGGRTDYSRFFNQLANGKLAWQAAADEALRQGLLMLDSRPAPAGEMMVVMGPGWAGIVNHEAVGHPLEGDANRKNNSVYAGRMGQIVASPNVTIIDDGSIVDRRGSLSIDDEGTPTNRTVLIENGRLVNYMQDRLNARLMGMKPTGNGRRQDYRYPVIPRMTNTIMGPGNSTPAEIIEDAKNGIYAAGFDNGQVDPTSGRFVFATTEAYMIENGKITYPVKGAMIIGKSGPEVLSNVRLVANDFALDDGIGTCGKDGQGVPVGVGQPTFSARGLTVGGTGGPS